LNEKVEARDDVIAISKLPRSSKLYVRVNALTTPFFFGDMRSVVTAHIDGIILPMVETSHDLVITEWLLSTLEIENEKPAQSIDSMLENKGRVERISFGAGDFTNDAGINWGEDGTELLYARSQLVIASRAAGLEPPLDTAFLDLDNQEGLANESRHAKNLGFQ